MFRKLKRLTHDEWTCIVVFMALVALSSGSCLQPIYAGEVYHYTTAEIVVGPR